MAQAQRPSTIYRPGGPIINLVGTMSFQAIMFIKEGQTYCAAHFATKLFHMQVFSKNFVLKVNRTYIFKYLQWSALIYRQIVLMFLRIYFGVL